MGGHDVEQKDVGVTTARHLIDRISHPQASNRFAKQRGEGKQGGVFGGSGVILFHPPEGRVFGKVALDGSGEMGKIGLFGKEFPVTNLQKLQED